MAVLVPARARGHTAYAAAMDGREHEVCGHISERRARLVELLQALIGFDTVTTDDGAAGPALPELQRHLAARLEAAGAQVTVVEPDDAIVAGHPFAPPGFTFAGRPQLVARFAGAGAAAPCPRRWKGRPRCGVTPSHPHPMPGDTASRRTRTREPLARDPRTTRARLNAGPGGT